MALGAILGAAVTALCCVGMFTAKDTPPATPENLLPLALTSEPAVQTGVATPVGAGHAAPAAAVTTVGTTTTVQPTTTTTTAARTTTTTVTTTTVTTTTRATTTERPTTTEPPPTTTTTRHPCSLLFC